MDWRAGEREILIFMAHNGPADQKRLAETLSLPAATINLAKDDLLKRGYITLKGREIRGRGAPRKIYALTPPGLVAAIVEGELWDHADPILEHWREIAPVFIRSYRVLDEWGFTRDLEEICRSILQKHRPLIEVVGKGAHQLVCYLPSRDVVAFTTEKDLKGYELIDPWKGLLWIIDRGFYTEMHRRRSDATLRGYIEMVKSDRALREGWLRWYEGEEERFRRLKEQREIILKGTSEDEEELHPP